MFPLEPTGSRTTISDGTRGERLLTNLHNQFIVQKHIRQQFRRLRQELTHRQQQDHAQSACTQLINTANYQSATHLAAYIAADGELDPQPIIEHALHQQKQVYLPCLAGGDENRLLFCEYRIGDRLKDNRFGIPEPDRRLRPPVDIRALDIILLPLVAFDDACNRIGMGGGFYDRTLSLLTKSTIGDTPRLYGYAHEIQKSDRLARNEWDIPMDHIITELRTYSRL